MYLEKTGLTELQGAGPGGGRCVQSSGFRVQGFANVELQLGFQGVEELISRVLVCRFGGYVSGVSWLQIPMVLDHIPQNQGHIISNR